MHLARRSTVLVVALALATTVSLAGPQATKGERRSMELFRDLPRDPLLVLGAWVEDPADQLRGALDLLARLDAGIRTDFGDSWKATSEGIDRTLEREILPQIGPEIVLSVDLPPLDDALVVLNQPDGGVAALLGRSGLVARVRNGARLDGALRRMFVRLGGEVSETDGLVRVDLPLPSAEGVEPRWLPLYYRTKSHRLVLGFTPDWVRRGLAERPEGERLVDGADFMRVFRALDANPSDLTYVNLPKLRAYVAESAVAGAVLAQNENVRQIVERFFNQEVMGVGLGSTSVVLDHGVRTTYFGPHWLSGAAVSGALVATAAVPSLLASVDHGRTERTVSDVEAIGVACEGFSSDSRSYPGPTEGWVPVDRIAAYLEPVYIAALPRKDGWEHPLLYWSDGTTYRVVSTGRDGQMDRDWSVAASAQALAELDGDIVFGDGRLLVVPGR